jgi:hypothetical protein
MGEQEDRQGESSEEKITGIDQETTRTAQDESKESEIVKVETDIEE